MLQIVIEPMEFLNDVTQEFVWFPQNPQVLQLEHSLISISKWEQKWKKPFLSSKEGRTNEEMIDYIKCMTISPQNIDPRVYRCITDKTIDSITAYIYDPMTATTIHDRRKPGNKRKKEEIYTNEVIYALMIGLQIPVDICQKWHLNRLLTLIRVCQQNTSPPEKMSRREMAEEQRRIMSERRTMYNTNG